jgi:hypothetical protein
MLTVTPEGCPVHWPGTYSLNSNIQLIEEASRGIKEGAGEDLRYGGQTSTIQER